MILTALAAPPILLLILIYEMVGSREREVIEVEIEIREIMFLRRRNVKKYMYTKQKAGRKKTSPLGAGDAAQRPNLSESHMVKQSAEFFGVISCTLQDSNQREHDLIPRFRRWRAPP